MAFDPMEMAPKCPLMAMAWADCLRFVISDQKALAAFTRDTGVAVKGDPLSRMIDAQTGYDAEVARRFVAWFNETVWGDVTLEAGR